ncbi:MAG: radical SAM protein [Planctomycetes bacterium]|nr:radical SAM protein [Planctomycetota bacterium]
MRIGLLAMSGVRAHDPKLLELGLTLPGFVDRSKVVASLPSLGLLYLAAATPEGHDVRYYEAEGDGKEPAEVYTCDLVAISTFSAQVFEAYAIADRLRAAGVKVAMGGLHVSVRPEEALTHADYVIVGEGENVWPAVVEAAERGEGRGLFDARQFPPVDVARLPVPRYDLLAGRPYNRFTVQTSRGCPWRCDFCASTVMLRQAYRKRPVADVIRDIRAIAQLREHPYIEFADDNTFVDKAWGKQLCRELAPLRLKWFTETDISIADDEELLDLMREAGCRQVLVGLESPTPRDLEGMELKTNFKARRAHAALESVRAIQDHGITVNGCFILGLDEHTPEIFPRVLDFAMEVPLYEVQITVLTPFPGTPLYARLLKEGRLLEPGRWDRCTLFDVNYQPKNMSPQELRDGLYWLSERLYSREGVAQRRRGFFENLRRRRPAALHDQVELAMA